MYIKYHGFKCECGEIVAPDFYELHYKNFKEKINIVKEELRENRHVEIWYKQKVIYSERKDKNGKI